ncbi:uncharacterized protein ACR2FA_002717 [Aphomia sociella]
MFLLAYGHVNNFAALRLHSRALKAPIQGVKCKVTLPVNFLFLDQISAMIKAQYVTFVCVIMLSAMLETASVVKRSYSDQSVRGYITERTCWWNEVCKEEFQILFRCKCPSWSYCRSPGRYYNAICSMTETGYIWDQPNSQWRGQ